MARGGARAGAGRPKKAVTVPGSSLPADILIPAADADLSPLQYMLRVMRDRNSEPERRDRMAMAAAPFVHSRAGDGTLGKRAEANEAAKGAELGTDWEALLAAPETRQ